MTTPTSSPAGDNNSLPAAVGHRHGGRAAVPLHAGRRRLERLRSVAHALALAGSYCRSAS